MEKQLQIIVRESALNDLEKECQFLAEYYSVDYAEKFRVAFFEVIKAILPHPVKYPECRFLETKNRIYRNIIWGNYLIIYKIRKPRIEVLVLFHTKQHPRKLKRARRIRRANKVSTSIMCLQAFMFYRVTTEDGKMSEGKVVKM